MHAAVRAARGTRSGIGGAQARRGGGGGGSGMVDYPPLDPAAVPLSVRTCASRDAGGGAADPDGPGRRAAAAGPDCAPGMRRYTPPLDWPAFCGAARGPPSGVGG